MRKVILILLLVSIASLAIAQDQYVNRDIRPNMSLEDTRTYTLDFFNGVSFPQGDLNNFLRNGFNSGILFHRNFCKQLSLGLSANHSRFNYRQSFGSIQGSNRKELSTTSFDIGPQYNMRFGRFSLEFYGRSGLSIVNSPQSTMLYPETDVTITSLQAYKSTALTTRLGANMTAYICEGLDFYFSSEYLTSFNSDMNYRTRDVSEAVREDGTLDSDLANDLPYSNENLSLSMLNVNIGVRISIGGNGSKRRPNPFYKTNRNSDTNPIYKGLRFQYKPQETSRGTREQYADSIQPDLSMGETISNTELQKLDMSLPEPLTQQFTDLKTNTINESFSPGQIASIKGTLLKFDEDDDKQGIFFIAADSSETRVSNVVKNQPSELLFFVPESLTTGTFQIEVRTIFKNNKSMRTSRLLIVLTPVS